MSALAAKEAIGVTEVLEFVPRSAASCAWTAAYSQRGRKIRDV